MYSSDEEPDHELLELLRQSRGLNLNQQNARPETHVLKSAEFIVDHSIDVALDRQSVVNAADAIYNSMHKRAYSTETWSQHELHPKAHHEDTPAFIFTMDLLNFSFYSELDEEERFRINYGGKAYTGYWSLVALLQRALDEGIPITSPYFWVDEEICTDEILRHVFRSDSKEEISLANERIQCLREAGEVLCERYDGDFRNCIKEANHSAAALVMLLVENFPCFNDESEFEGKTVRFYKRAQILVADIWACYNKEWHGRFDDISTITMFADYRVPVILHSLGCLLYAPKLEQHIRAKGPIPHGHSWEVQLRGCSIWAVEMIRRTIEKKHPGTSINSILIDFYLYDTAKEMERKELEARRDARTYTRNLDLDGHGDKQVFGGEATVMIPHHRTRSIWY